jgi:ABC-type phosphate/phosphonate transport system substrate-binding protein
MRWIARLVRQAGVLTLLPLSAGCYQSTGLRVLNFLGLEKQPVVLALVAESRGPGAPKLLEVVNPFLPYEPLQRKLADVLGRPVALEFCFPLQLEPNLHNGMYDLAIVSAAQYGRFDPAKAPPALAIAMDVPDAPARPGVLIVKSDAPLTRIEDLRGKSVGFGPDGDSRTEYAALELLARHGLRRSDLSLEILPIPGTLKHYADGASAARAVLDGGVHAAFIDEAAWEALPATVASSGEVARADLRILGRTLEVPDRLFVASPTLPEKDQQAIRSFLASAKERAPQVLEALRCAGYAHPNPQLLEACRQIVPRDEPAPAPPPESG